MRWARDVVAEHRADLMIRSVRSLLTATTRVTVVGMDADPSAVRAPETLDVAEIAIGTLIMSGGDAVNATVISTMIASGVVAGEAFLTPS